MTHKLLLLRTSAVALVLFTTWTVVVRANMSEGSRSYVWVDAQFGEWPAKVTVVHNTADIQLSIVASYAVTDRTQGAAAPAGIPALFGRASIGSVVDVGDSNNINGSRFTTGIRAGPISSISVFIPAPVDAAPHDQYQLAVYDDSHGAPGHLLASTSSGTLAPEAWNTLPIAATLQPKTSYWLMYNTNGSTGTVNNLTYTPVSGDPLDNAIRSHSSPTRAKTADRFTAIGGVTPTVLALIAVSLFSARRRRREGVALLIGFAAAMLVAWVVRDTLFEPFRRYPSGHALRVTYLAVGLAYVFPRRGLRVGGWLLVFLVSVAAVYSTGHYSEEIIGGVLLGWAFATGATALVLAPPPRSSGSAGTVGVRSDREFVRIPWPSPRR